MSDQKTFPKGKLSFLWENMSGYRPVFILGLLGTVIYNSLQLTLPVFTGKLVDLFLTGPHATENLSQHR